jgi:hypothetical protein
MWRQGGPDDREGKRNESSTPSRRACGISVRHCHRVCARHRHRDVRGRCPRPAERHACADPDARTDPDARAGPHADAACRRAAAAGERAGDDRAGDDRADGSGRHVPRARTDARAGPRAEHGMPIGPATNPPVEADAKSSPSSCMAARTSGTTSRSKDRRSATSACTPRISSSTRSTTTSVSSSSRDSAIPKCARITRASSGCRRSTHTGRRTGRP